MAVATFQQIKDRVKLLLGDPINVRWTDALIGEMVNEGYRRFARTLRNYVVSGATVSITSGVGTLPADFISVVRVSYSGNPLWKLDYREIQQYADSTGTVPTYYFIQGNKIKTYPVVTGISLTLDYIGTPADLTGSNTPDASMPPETEEYLVNFACAHLLQSAQDYEGGTAYLAMAIEAENRALDHVIRNDAYYGQGIGMELVGPSDSAAGWLD